MAKRIDHNISRNVNIPEHLQQKVSDQVKLCPMCRKIIVKSKPKGSRFCQCPVTGLEFFYEREMSDKKFMEAVRDTNATTFMGDA